VSPLPKSTMKAHFLKSHHVSLCYSPHDQTTSSALSQVTARWAELAAGCRRKFKNLTALNVRPLCVCVCARARRRMCVCVMKGMHSSSLTFPCGQISRTKSQDYAASSCVWQRSPRPTTPKAA
jgi:hypothetical protein